MKLSVELKDISPVKKRLEVVISSEDVEKEIEAAYRKLVKEVSVKGFRKGKVPRSIIERLYKDRVEGEVALKLIDKSLPLAFKGKGVSPLSTPEIEPHQKLEAGKEFLYSATFEVAPSIDVVGYEGLKLEKKKIAVEDEEIQKALKALVENHAHFEDLKTERPAKEGDLVVVDFAGTMEGRPIKDGKAKDYPVVIGSGNLLESFEKALIGMRKGEEKEIEVEFPDDYGNEELAGKKGTFKVNLKGIKEKIYPELSDDFARDLGFKDLEELKAKVREELVEEKEMAEKKRIREKVLKELIEKNPFEIPPRYFKEYEDRLFNQTVNTLYRQGRAPDDMDELRRVCRERAERDIRAGILIRAIAAKEGLSVSEEEIDEWIRSMAEKHGQSFEALKKIYRKRGMINGLRMEILEDKVFDLIESRALKVAEKTDI